MIRVSDVKYFNLYMCFLIAFTVQRFLGIKALFGITFLLIFGGISWQKFVHWICCGFVSVVACVASDQVISDKILVVRTHYGQIYNSM